MERYPAQAVLGGRRGQPTGDGAVVGILLMRAPYQRSESLSHRRQALTFCYRTSSEDEPRSQAVFRLLIEKGPAQAVPGSSLLLSRLETRR